METSGRSPCLTNSSPDRASRRCAGRDRRAALSSAERAVCSFSFRIITSCTKLIYEPRLEPLQTANRASMGFVKWQSQGFEAVLMSKLLPMEDCADDRHFYPRGTRTTCVSSDESVAAF